MTRPSGRRPDELRTLTPELFRSLMAVGLDPDVCTLFVQSHVHEHAELSWLLECTVSFGELRRMRIRSATRSGRLPVSTRRSW